MNSSLLPMTDSQTGIPPPIAWSDPSLARIVGAMAWPTAAKLRVYVDTSVIGGCEDDEFREPSRRLFRRFARGDLTLVLSPAVLEELEAAPREVSEILRAVPEAHIELLEAWPEATLLAAKYVDQGALTYGMFNDALHIANATIARADLLVSWNFKHIVNARRIKTFNEVNCEMGYGALDIRSPREMEDDS